MLKSILLGTCAALSLVSVAFASDPHIPPSSGDASANAGAAAVGVNTNLNTNLNAPIATAGGGSATAISAPVTSVYPDFRNTVSPDIRTTTTVNTSDVNLNGQDQRQGQLQGQHQGQGQGQFIAGSGNSRSDSSASSNQNQSLTDASTHTLTANTGASTSQSSSAGQSATFTDNSVYEAQRRNPVASAYAAPLSIGGGVCVYTPASASVQTIVFGASGSAAKHDAGCERRAAADMFARLGQYRAACTILLTDPVVRKALPGYTCPDDAAPAPVVQAAPPVAVIPPVADEPIPAGPTNKVPRG